MLDTVLKKYLKRCLDNSGFKISLFVDKANIGNLKDTLKEIKPDYDASFEFSDMRSINKGLTMKSGNDSVFTICPVTDGKLAKQIKYNCALVDEALKGREKDLIFPLAENYDDGTKDGVPATYIFISI